MIELRFFASLAAFPLALSACNADTEVPDRTSKTSEVAAAPASAEVPDSPSKVSEVAPVSVPVDEAELVRLSGENIAISGPVGATLAFGSPRDAVEREVSRILGEPSEVNVNQECGAGPVGFASFVGGLTLNFQDEKLVGWTLNRDENEVDIATAEGVAVGSAEGELAKVYAVTLQEGSTLGDEFYSDEGIGGFYVGEEGSKSVESLFAGTTCFFR